MPIVRTELPLLRDLSPLDGVVVRCVACGLLVLHREICITQAEADVCMSSIEFMPLENTDGPRRGA